MAPQHAMGTKMAPSFVNLFLGIFGSNVDSNALFYHHTWWRYLDDIFMIWNGELDQLKIFVYYLNNHSTIKFASNHSLTTVLFLDVIRLRVVSHLLSPSSETRKKPARKNGRARSWGRGSHSAIFSRGFFSRLARPRKRKRDYP